MVDYVAVIFDATFMGYDCRKATVDFAGRTYTAWFTPEIPLPFGPYKFGGLPGLILKIEDAERQFVWEASHSKTNINVSPDAFMSVICLIAGNASPARWSFVVV